MGNRDYTYLDCGCIVSCDSGGGMLGSCEIGDVECNFHEWSRYHKTCSDCGECLECYSHETCEEIDEIIEEINKTDENYGLELILDIHNCDPSTFNRDSIRAYFKELCKLIDMERCKLTWWDDYGVWVLRITLV